MFTFVPRGFFFFPFLVVVNNNISLIKFPFAVNCHFLKTHFEENLPADQLVVLQGLI